MEKEKKKSKKFIIIIAVAILAIAGGIVAFVLSKKEAYRIIKVYEVTGNTVITREGKGDLEAYANMLLQSGDDVFVKDGRTTLKLDEDKFVYAESNTKFNLIATGSSKNSKTKIHLSEGAITNEIDNKLSDKSSYEINTENSNMSVRGTVYRVEVYVGEDGVKYTKLTVFSGTVATRIVNEDGSLSEDEVLVDKCKEIIMYQTEEERGFYTEVRDIVYEELPQDVIEWIIEKVEEQKLDLELPVVEEIKQILENMKEPGPFEVTFMYGDQVFGKQTVKNNDLVIEPKLIPTESGYWDFDFNTPITEETIINWIETEKIEEN